MITPDEIEKARKMLRDLYAAAKMRSSAKSASFDGNGLYRLISDIDGRISQLKMALRQLGVDITDEAISQQLLEAEEQQRQWAEKRAADKEKDLAAVQERQAAAGGRR